MSELDPALLAFRPLALGDIPMVFRWFHLPHAVQWFGKERTLEAVADKYEGSLLGDPASHAFIVTLSGRDIGLVEWCRFGDHEDVMQLYGVTDPWSVNIDVLLGEPDVVHRGLGVHVIRRFSREVVFAADARFTQCFIDPEVENKAAIRCYEKVGFHHVSTPPDDGEHGVAIHLMGMTKAELQ